MKLNFQSATLIPLIPLVVYILFQSPLWALVSMIVTILMRPLAVKETAKLVNSNPITNQGINDSLVNTFSTGITAFYSLLLGFCLKYYSLWYSTLIVMIILSSFCLLFFIFKNKIEKTYKTQILETTPI